ncbi:MAG: short-chain dehydrogenase [Gemmatimonadetes bacterium 13_2_20CM_70_9]|nr:MAG: short-chain dehydrogenase [Gemmatimonadetes bacterium 13_2_20CM_70_9]
MSAGTAVVTGASSGIGLELARLLARDGYDLVLVARSVDKLDRLGAELAARHGIRARTVGADLASPDAPGAIAEMLKQAALQVDVLVNNAGYGTSGPFATTELRTELDLLQVNVIALTHLTKLVLPAMLAAKRGRILNVASTAAFQPGPFMAVYYASKAYVLSFSEALAEELSGTGVTVTTLCPGPVPTGFQARAGVDLKKVVRTPLVMDAAAVARAGYVGLMKGKRLVVPGLGNKLLVQSERFAPRRLVTKIARFLQEQVRA